MQEWQQEIIQRLKEGNYFLEFCAYAEVSTQTIYRMRDGKKLKEKTLWRIKQKWEAFKKKKDKLKEELAA